MHNRMTTERDEILEDLRVKLRGQATQRLEIREVRWSIGWEGIKPNLRYKRSQLSYGVERSETQLRAGMMSGGPAVQEPGNLTAQRLEIPEEHGSLWDGELMTLVTQ